MKKQRWRFTKKWYSLLKKGTKITITTIQEKDFLFLDGEFEKLSELVNGQEGIILSHNRELPQFDERESYQVLIKCKDGTERELEIELDEFFSEHYGENEHQNLK